jgi:hypothetical protein
MPSRRLKNLRFILPFDNTPRETTIQPWFFHPLWAKPIGVTAGLIVSLGANDAPAPNGAKIEIGEKMQENSKLRQNALACRA